MTQTKKKPYKRIAVAVSLCMILLSVILCAVATLSYFNASTPEMTNVFKFGDFKVEVSHRLENGTWETIDGHTDIFDDEALYEPGYVQVVFLKVENKGTVAIDFHTEVFIAGTTAATNVSGAQFNLQDYLKFGVSIADTEADLEKTVESRDLAKAIATMDLGDYATEVATLEAGETSYLALIVRMPEEVGNDANYRGDVIPKVELGIVAEATQHN